MHGIVLWNKNSLQGLASLCDRNQSEQELDRILIKWQCHSSWSESQVMGSLSTVITWEDSRCSEEFLSQLPMSDFGAISSGFGCATLFWLARNTIALVNAEATHAGTLADLVVCLLSWSNADDATLLVRMTDHNAASWGYFDTANRKWEFNALSPAKFPTRFLPLMIVDVGTVVGQLQRFNGFHGDVAVHAAVGDFQASLRATLDADDSGVAGAGSALFNIGTSAQMAVLLKNEDFLTIERNDATSVFPFSTTHSALVAASLNGGNVLAELAKTVRSTLAAFDVKVEMDEIWRVMLNESINEPTSKLRVNPKLFGERHDPEAGASVDGITGDNMKMGSLLRAICQGILDNLLSMLPLSIIKSKGISSVGLAGGAFEKNPILVEEAEKALVGMNIRKCEGWKDAAYGAALFALDQGLDVGEKSS